MPRPFRPCAGSRRGSVRTAGSAPRVRGDVIRVSEEGGRIAAETAGARVPDAEQLDPVRTVDHVTVELTDHGPHPMVSAGKPCARRWCAKASR